MLSFLENVPLRDKTTYKIGGLARYYCAPVSVEEIIDASDHARREVVSVFVLGRGSNILISDQGWPGLVIDLTGFNRLDWHDEHVEVQGGALLDKLVGSAVLRGCAGMEELSGIPGTVGGAVIMNAGAYSTSIADAIESALVLDLLSNTVRTLTAAELGFGYRTSILHGTSAIVLSARFALCSEDGEKLRIIRQETLLKRKMKQPLDLPNCGSVFKRPPGKFAGHLIEQAGLKGYRIGNAEISARHANFIVNTGGATAGDVRRLIAIAQKKVFEHAGVLLEPEVIFVGEFEEPLFSPH